MFQLNLSDFHNDENQENHKKFLSCEKSETGSPLQIRQQNQLKKMIQNQNQLCNIYEIASAFPFDEVDRCYQYQRDPKLTAKVQSQEFTGIWNIEKNQLIQSIKIKNKINGKRWLVAISSDNTTVLQVSQQDKETLLNFTDLEQQNCQEVRLENGEFQAFWKKDDKVFILFQKLNILQLYSLSLYKDQKLSLNVERIIDVDDWFESFIKLIDKQCFYVIMYLRFTIYFLKNLKNITFIPLNGKISDIKMLMKGILLIRYNYQGRNPVIQMRQTWNHKSIRQKKLERNWALDLLYESLYVSKYLKRMDVEEYTFYDLFQGEEILKIITTHTKANINPPVLRKILLDFQKAFVLS